MPHRDFGTDAKAEEGVTFTIGAHDYTYHCVDADHVPAGVILDMSSLGAESTSSQQLAVLTEFLDAIMDDTDAEHFAQRMRGEIKPPIGLGELTDMVEWLMEVYTGRPPEPSPTSPASPRQSGRPSTPGRSKQASTR